MTSLKKNVMSNAKTGRWKKNLHCSSPSIKCMGWGGAPKPSETSSCQSVTQCKAINIQEQCGSN